MTADDIKKLFGKHLKTLGYPFDFCAGEEYMEWILVEFSDFNR